MNLKTKTIHISMRKPQCYANSGDNVVIQKYRKYVIGGVFK